LEKVCVKLESDITSLPQNLAGHLLYLAVPEHGSGPGVLVLHAWWGLNDVFKQVCDRLAREGFIALAPDLYHGKTTTSTDEAYQLASEHIMSEETSQDLTASIAYLLNQPGRRGKALTRRR